MPSHGADRAAAPRAAIAGRTGLPVRRGGGLAERRGLGEGGGDGAGLGGQHAVGPAQHGILLVQQGRKAGALGGIDRRHRGIAAEAHDEGRPQSDHEPARLEIAAQKLRDALGAAQQAAAGKPRRRDAKDLDRRQAVAEAAAAAVGDQDRRAGRGRGARGPAPPPETYGRRCRRRRADDGPRAHEIPPGPKRRRDERQQHAHGQRQSEQRGAAIADEGQRHALGRHQMQAGGHVDDRLQAEIGDQPRGRQHARRGSSP